MRWILELLDRHGATVSLGAAAVLSAALMSLGDRGQAKVRAAVQVALWPSQRAVSLAEEYCSLLGRNRRLAKALAEATVNGDLLAELESENERLRDLLDFAKRSEFELIPAQVVRRDAGPLCEVLLVDKGRRDGVGERMTVVCERGLVGVVVNAGESSSEVRLLTSKDFAASATIAGKNVHGVVKWDPALWKLKMLNVPVHEDVTEGDVVLTSSLGGNFVDGVRVGRVERVRPGEEGLFKEITLETPAYLWSVREVFVIPRIVSSASAVPASEPGADSAEHSR